MKILLVSSLYGTDGGGAGLITEYLAQGLKEAAHQVSVAILGLNHRYSVTEENSIRVYRFRPANLYPLAEKDKHSAWQKGLWQILDVYNAHSARVMRSILGKESPDIVHIHKMRGFSGSVWSTTTSMFPGRVIQTCHDYESMSPDGLLRGSIGRMALSKKWPVRGYQLIRARLSAGVTTVTSPSKFTLQRIQDSGLFPNAQGRVVANTHGWSKEELESFHKHPCVAGERKIRFLFLGRLEKEKGIRELCKAFLQAYELHKGMELEIAGWGSLEKELQKEYDGHPGIKFLGTIWDQSKRDALCNSTVVIVPSQVDEVFGLVTVEAYAFGKPVIATRVGGLPELVRHGETGWLVEPGDVDALARQLYTVATMDPLSLARMGQTCREYSFRFSMESVLKEYLDLYEGLLK